MNYTVQAACIVICVSANPSDGFGARLAYYRRLSGMSAQLLSDQIGGALSRAVIANIESGRKKDITVDELIMLASALGVPPVALALPLDRPYQFVRTVNAENSVRATRAYEVAKWFITGDRDYYATSGRRANPARAVAMSRIKMLDEWDEAQQEIRKATKKLESGDSSSDWASILEDEQERLRGIEARLGELDVDLTVYRFDE